MNNCHDNSCGDNTAKAALWLALILNFGMFAIEIWQGVNANSTSLIADSMDFLSDGFNYAISLAVFGLALSTRAKASIFLAQGRFADAIAEIERGRESIVDFLQQSNFPELASKSAEIAFLEEWLEEVKAKRPLSKLEIMQREMETAIAKELYERAAELRDAIRLLKTQKQV